MASLLIAARKLWRLSESEITITYNGAGAQHFPVEIWQEIFDIASTLVVAPASLRNEFKSMPEPGARSLCESPTAISELELQRSGLFALRRTIILVCKVWYYIGISALHSHVCIDFNRSKETMEHLYQGLKQNHNFASTVLRLSVKGGTNYPEKGSELDLLRKKDEVFRKIIARIPNVKIVTCPNNLARGYNASFRPEVTIIYPDPRNYSREFYNRLSCGIPFWQYSRTISLTVSGEPWFTSIHDNKSPSKPKFPNLVNLKLDVRDYSTTEWIVSDWNVSTIQRLSITSPRAIIWSSFIQQSITSLVSLEIILSYGFDAQNYSSSPLPPVKMPKLKSLCLSYASGDSLIDFLQPWITHIQAPSLHRFIFHVQHLIMTHGDPRLFGQKMNRVIQCYPTVKALGICYHEDQNITASGLSIAFPIVAMLDIIDWCEAGFSVEIFQEGGRNKKMYSKETGYDWPYGLKG